MRKYIQQNFLIKNEEHQVLIRNPHFLIHLKFQIKNKNPKKYLEKWFILISFNLWHEFVSRKFDFIIRESATYET